MVDNGEQRGVGAETDGQRRADGESERRRLGEHSAAVANVAGEILQSREPALIAHLFHRLRQATGLQARGSSGLF